MLKSVKVTMQYVLVIISVNRSDYVIQEQRCRRYVSYGRKVMVNLFWCLCICYSTVVYRYEEVTKEGDVSFFLEQMCDFLCWMFRNGSKEPAFRHQNFRFRTHEKK